jgi:hypothetical protein
MKRNGTKWTHTVPEGDVVVVVIVVPPNTTGWSVSTIDEMERNGTKPK